MQDRNVTYHQIEFDTYEQLCQARIEAEYNVNAEVYSSVNLKKGIFFLKVKVKEVRNDRT